MWNHICRQSPTVMLTTHKEYKCVCAQSQQWSHCWWSHTCVWAQHKKKPSKRHLTDYHRGLFLMVALGDVRAQSAFWPEGCDHLLHLLFRLFPAGAVCFWECLSMSMFSESYDFVNVNLFVHSFNLFFPDVDSNVLQVLTLIYFLNKKL